MGAREMPAVLVRLADAAGNSIEITDAKLAAPFLKDYTDAIGRMPSATVETSGLRETRIGQIDVIDGGVYAGLCRGENGGADYHLFVHADEKESIKWQDAVEWARGLAEGALQDYNLPTRKEQAVLFGNVPELFKPEWYWSIEAHASDPANAWYQSFYYGNQSSYWKGGNGRARAVRRSPSF